MAHKLHYLCFTVENIHQIIRVGNTNSNTAHVFKTYKKVHDHDIETIWRLKFVTMRTLAILLFITINAYIATSSDEVEDFNLELAERGFSKFWFLLKICKKADVPFPQCGRREKTFVFDTTCDNVNAGILKGKQSSENVNNLLLYEHSLFLKEIILSQACVLVPPQSQDVLLALAKLVLIGNWW